MSTKNYNETVEAIFSELNHNNFVVNFSKPPIIFVCGGPINGLGIAESVRQRVFDHFAKVANTKNDKDDPPQIIDHLIAAEDFKDYFKNSIYDDLMKFEDDIASIASLVVIFLESAGSLVELGLFCNRKELKDRILVFVPSEELEAKNNTPAYSSFIYLGAMQSLKNRNKSSVQAYPWADPNVLQYDELEFIASDIQKKLCSLKNQEKFDGMNSGHIALLTHDIIKLCEVPKFHEIEMCFICLDIDVSSKDIERSLYLLEKFKLASFYEYSGTKYYYVLDTNLTKIRFGKTIKSKTVSHADLQMQVRTSIIPELSKDSSEVAKKRLNAFKKISSFRSKK
ncbi:retron St85 family effector protein [Pseudoalteromonas sp. OANN1]|uniref:retron St85 family effector protein n=1 Tax=Pseudoalteromonas sp. OANN1 TaxID=2954497 RepID=UPI002096F7D5|nr:retron St85 family effector protein [Pseudoalteromonas sp. OANN1]MCO7200301.1 retron St85 family effector protein [Pseudoalteromonas sp. OANN1]